MNTQPEWVKKKLNRLDFLAKLFEENGFAQIASEIKSIRLEKEVDNFYRVLKVWFL